VAAHCWDCSDSWAIHHPLAAWLSRLRDGRAAEQGRDLEAWRRVQDRWEGAGCPRPWLREADQPHAGQLGLRDARLRDAEAPDPFAGRPERGQLHPDVAEAERREVQRAIAAAQAAAEHAAHLERAQDAAAGGGR
jgi:hypothetical protein